MRAKNAVAMNRAIRKAAGHHSLTGPTSPSENSNTPNTAPARASGGGGTGTTVKNINNNTAMNSFIRVHSGRL